MTSVLLSRFVMNLRGVYIPSDSAGGSFHSSRMSDIRFANSIVGNLGAPLGFEEEHNSLASTRPEGEDIQVVKISDDPLTEYLTSALDDIPSAASEEVEART